MKNVILTRVKDEVETVRWISYPAVVWGPLTLTYWSQHSLQIANREMTDAYYPQGASDRDYTEVQSIDGKGDESMKRKHW